MVLIGLPAAAAVTGSLSGAVADQTGSVIPGAKVTLTNTNQGIQNKTTTDAHGGLHVSSRFRSASTAYMWKRRDLKPQTTHRPDDRSG